MEPEIEAEASGTTTLLGVFLLSGAAGLTWQTVWARELELLFGTTTFAIATVLSTFMAGLGLGAWLAGRRDVRDPLLVYAALEALIGGYALLFPRLVDAVQPLYLAIGDGMSPVAFGAVQYVLIGGLLLVPTAAMGATLPVLVRFAVHRMDDAGDRIGLLYAVNTAGAVFGTWATGFWLLPAWGLGATTLATAALNLGLAGAALALRAVVGAGAQPVPAQSTPARGENILAVVAFLAGFASLIDEVAWFRLLSLMLGASAYAFSTMLLAFLVGIAIGGRVGGPIADRVWARGGTPAVLRALAVVQLGVATLSIGAMYLYPNLPMWYVWLFRDLGAAETQASVWVVSTLIAGCVMTPPALFMGATFPFLVRAATRSGDDAAGAVSRIYAANTAGSVLGAAIAGFVLLPTLAVQGTVFLAGACNVLGATAAAVTGDRPRGRFSAALVAAAGAGGLLVAWQRPLWDPLLMTCGTYQYVTGMEDTSREGIWKFAVEQYELLYYREGLSSVVTVARDKDSGNIWLANNGKVDASTSLDMPTQVLVSLLPMQFVKDPDDVLVIGLASGITAGAVSTVDDVKRLEVVELEPAILEAARLFDAHNHQILDDPRVRLVATDGRNHVLRAPEARWDVVVSEPSNPWLTGVANLFTKEFFEIGRSRLKPGGVWAQWVQVYGMDDRDVRSLLKTFASVFPHVQLYAAAADADLVLIGSEQPLEPGIAAAERLLGRWPRAAAELEAIGLTHPAHVAAHWMMDETGIEALKGGWVMNTDDSLFIEYSAPLHLHQDTQRYNNRMLGNAAQRLDVGDDPTVLDALARGYFAREDCRSVETAEAAVTAFEVDDPARDALASDLARWRTELPRCQRRR